MAEPLNATFYTLRQRDRAVLLPATIIMVVLEALLAAAFIAVNWQTLIEFVAFFKSAIPGGFGPTTAGGGVSKAPPMALFSGMFMMFGTGMLLSFPAYLVLASYEAACLRWMIRGEAPGLFGLTLNDDTWRVYGVYWCWIIGQVAISWIASLVALPIMFAAMGSMIQTPPTDMAAMMRWQLTVQLPLSLLQYVPLAFFGLRLGPAAATSIALQRFSFFEAWKVTRGRFGALLGSYVVLWLIGAVVIAVSSAPAAALIWPHFPPLNRIATAEEVQAYFTAFFAPRMLLVIGLGYAVLAAWGIWYALMSYGINARAVLAALDEGKIERGPAPT